MYSKNYEQFMPPAQIRPFIDRIPDHIMYTENTDPPVTFVNSPIAPQGYLTKDVNIVDDRKEYSGRTYLSVSVNNLSEEEAQEIIEFVRSRHVQFNVYFDEAIQSEDED